ncbi:hypothetical protein SH2C18_12400 [Clostridium sediminicola]|uniref:hypothetical protein n=1 Tax=Clostridium sediminicola TaxID=3114879 RepID=UPI0031F1C623
MKDKRTLIVRVNYSIVDNVTENRQKKLHIIKANNEKISKYLIGGGYCNKYGGSFTFKARDLNEAKLIADNNLFVKNKPYKYEMLIMDERTLIA